MSRRVRMVVADDYIYRMTLAAASEMRRNECKKKKESFAMQERVASNIAPMSGGTCSLVRNNDVCTREIHLPSGASKACHRSAPRDH